MASNSFKYDSDLYGNLLTNIKVQCVDSAVETLRNETPKTVETIRTVWKGAASDAFLEKLEKDSNTICDTLLSIQANINNSLSKAAHNDEDVDDYVAQFFKTSNNNDNNYNSSYVPTTSSTSMSSDSVTLEAELTEEERNNKVFEERLLLDQQQNYEAVTSQTNTVLDNLKAAGASVANIGISVTEGIANFGENLIDGACYVGVGFTSIFTGVYDLFTGSNTTKEMWQDTINTLGGSVTSEWYDKLYETDFVSSLNDAAFDIAKRDGLGYKIGKTAGVVAGNVLLGAATGGIANGIMSATTSSLVAQGGAAASASVFIVDSAVTTATTISITAAGGLSGMGRSVESSIRSMDNAYDENGNHVYDVKNLSGGDIAKVMGKSVIDGSVDAAAWYLTSGGGLEKAQVGTKILNSNAANTKVFRSVTSKLENVVGNAEKQVNYMVRGGVSLTKKTLKALTGVTIKTTK